MNTYQPSLWDHLMSKPDPAGLSSRITLAQLKGMIARDMEALLNTRAALPDESLASYPEYRKSIANYGLADFAQLCLTSSVDRKAICDSITDAITRHEPRLRNVGAELVQEAGSINRLSFVISGTIHSHAVAGAVDFNVMLEPSCLRYSIR